MKPRGPNHDWSIIPAEAVPGRHCVYLVRDAEGGVLYVGRTRDLRRRMAKGHRYRASWFARMASIDILPCDGVAEARALEKAKIAEHRPPANVKDVLPRRAPKRVLPARYVARLVELHEAVLDAHLWHHDQETAVLNAYVTELRREGWTLDSIGHALNMSRQAVQQRLARSQQMRAAA